MDNQNMNGTNGMGNLPNAQGVYGGGNMVNGMQNTQNIEPLPSFQPDKKPTKKLIVIGIVAALAIIVIAVVVIMLLSKSKKSEGAAYLPKTDSGYDAVCVRSSEYAEGMTLEETVGMTEIKDRGYISYSFVQVISKDNGSAIEKNENNLDATAELEDNLRSSGFLGVTSDFKDGKVVIEFGLSNYSYADAKDAIKDFEANGYSCK